MGNTMKKSHYVISFFMVLTLALCIFFHNLAFNVFSGRVSFLSNNTGQVLTMEDGEKFTVLRTLRVEDKNRDIDGYSIFIVRFKFNGLSFNTNKRLSLIPAPFLMNMKGFVQKTWTFNNTTNEFQGIYQWKSKDDAVHYPDSFVFKLMTKRAQPGTVNYRVIPKTSIENYMKKLSSNG